MNFNIGIDGGGTHTRVRVATVDGTIEAEISVRQTVKFFEIGFDESARRITALIVRAAKKAGAPMNAISGICIGLAGNGRESDQRRLRKDLTVALKKFGISPRKLRLETDAAIALPGALGKRSGVVLICGTGAIAIGRTATNTIVRVGGWGRIFGDEGSGYWIGVQALNAVGKDLDGRGPHTALTNAVFKTFTHVKDREPRVLRSAIASGVIRVEGIAPLVSKSAAAGDTIAKGILRRAADELCDQLAAMHRTNFPNVKNVPLVFHGSVIEHSTVGPLLRRSLQRQLPGAYRVTQPAGSPLDGAIFLLKSRSPSTKRV